MTSTRRHKLVLSVVGLVAVAAGFEIANTTTTDRDRVVSTHAYFEQRCVYDLQGNLSGCEPTDERLRQKCSGSTDHLVLQVEIVELGGLARSRDIITDGLTCRHILLAN